MIQHAFNIADAIQSPVVFLTEKNLMEGYQILEMSDVERVEREFWKGGKEYRRYEGQISIPGQKGGEYVATSDEHDSTGFTTENPEEREKQARRRMRKLEKIKPWKPVKTGESDFLVIGFGFTKSIAIEAMKHEEFSYLHIPMLWPLPSKEIREKAEEAKKAVVFEANLTGQLSKLIAMETGIQLESIGWAHGRVIYPEDFALMVRRWKNG